MIGPSSPEPARSKLCPFTHSHVHFDDSKLGLGIGTLTNGSTVTITVFMIFAERFLIQTMRTIVLIPVNSCLLTSPHQVAICKSKLKVNSQVDVRHDEST